MLTENLKQFDERLEYFKNLREKRKIRQRNENLIGKEDDKVKDINQENEKQECEIEKVKEE